MRAKCSVALDLDREAIRASVDACLVADAALESGLDARGGNDLRRQGGSGIH